VVDELAGLRHGDAPVGLTAPVALIDHILARYHDVHRQQLPELIRMARRVESVHRENPNVPAGLAEALEAMEQELLGHMQKEEQILFPMLKSGGHPLVIQPIGMMRHEHVDHGGALAHVMALTNDATPPAGACNTWRALYGGLTQFSEDLVNHIHLENNVLFPQFEPQLAVAPTPAPQASGCGTGGCGCS
jgi:regulator of cell morphogenesis and NO signaling